MFDVQVEQNFSFISPEYAALFARSAATAFQSPLWLDFLYSSRLLSDHGAEPAVVTVRRRGDSGLVMVLPLVRRKHGLFRVVEFADFGVSDYAAPVCERTDCAELVEDADLRAQLWRALRPFDLLRLAKLRDDLLPFAGVLGHKTKSVPRHRSYSVDLERPFAQWRSQRMDPSLRKQLDKKRRQLARAGKVRFEVLERAEAISAAFLAMREFRWQRFQDRNDAMQSPGRFDFYLEVAQRGWATGLSRTYGMWLDDCLIACGFGLTHQGTFLLLLTGSDLQNLRHYSIGLLCMEDIVRDCIERGERTFDLTIGDEGYKKLFGTRTTPLSTTWRGGTLLGSLAAATLNSPKIERLARVWVRGSWGMDSNHRPDGKQPPALPLSYPGSRQEI